MITDDTGCSRKHQSWYDVHQAPGGKDARGKKERKKESSLSRADHVGQKTIKPAIDIPERKAERAADIV